MDYRPGLCSGCHSEQIIVKRKASGNLCNRCNSDRLKSRKEIKDRQARYEKPKKKESGELKLFVKIWKTRERVSFLTGKRLTNEIGTSFWFNLFAHLIPKGKYGNFRLREDNIILLTPNEHYLLDFGTEDQRNRYALENGCNWDKVYCLQEDLKKEYRDLYGSS
jgi:hypothetical protein